MVVRLYDKDMTFIKTFGAIRNIQISEELDTGYKTIQFQVPYSVGYIREEQKVEIDGYIYVIKEVNMEDYDCYTIYGKPYFSGLLSKRIDNYSSYRDSFADSMTDFLDGTGWTFSGDTITGCYTVNITNSTALEAIDTLRDLYQVELYFNTKEKNIEVYNERGSYKGVYILDTINLRECQVQSNTYDLVTRLIPIGKDNMTIQRVNNNCLWVENYEYTKEKIVGYYINTSIENAVDLLELAKDQLDEVSKPQTAYTIKLSSFPFELNVGDSIKIIDKIKGVNDIKRIKKKVDCPDDLDGSYIEVGSLQVSFDNIYKDLETAQKVVNDGTLRNLTELNKKYL